MSHLRESYDPQGEIDPGDWRVHIALDEEDADKVERAAPLVVPGERVRVYWEDGGDEDQGREDPILTLRVYAEDTEGARGEAAAIYSRIRGKAGLPPSHAEIVGHASASWSAVSLAVSQEAMDLHKQGRYALAVVRFQTLCELSFERTLSWLVEYKRPGEDPGKLIHRPVTLSRREAREVFEELSGKNPASTSWWPGYMEHLKRRNGVVHAGLAVSRDDSIASIETNHALSEWLLEIDEATISAT